MSLNGFEVVCDGSTVSVKTFDDVCIGRFSLDEIPSVHRLRESHDVLIAVATAAVDAWSGGAAAEIDAAFRHLQVAISKAEAAP